MSIGTNIRRLRETKKMTQESLAEKLGVTFQAVSSWERDEYQPETSNLKKLAEVFDVSVSSIIEDRHGAFETKDTIYNWEHMKTYVKTTASALGLQNAYKAVDYAVAAHEGQKRKKSEIPYIYHPLNMACHALSMGIEEDEIIAAIMLHDVVEDCGKTLDELPVSDGTKEIVGLMTKDLDGEGTKEEKLDRYYSRLASNPKAALVKCIDRCNNITTMSWGFSRKGIFRYIEETEKYYPRLLRAVKEAPEYTKASWLLKYQIESMLDIYKRLM